MVSDYETVISGFQNEINEEVFRHEQIEIDKEDEAVKLGEDMLQNIPLNTSEKVFNRLNT